MTAFPSLRRAAAVLLLAAVAGCASMAPEPPDTTSPFGEEEEEALDGRMTFLEHLDELRKRITHAVVALLVGFLAAFAFAERTKDFVYARLTADIPGHRLIYTEPGEAFFIYLKIAALSGLLLASPYIMWQVWLFIAPGLYAREKKLAIPFVIGSSSLFVAGAAFSHFVLFPAAWRFFADQLGVIPRTSVPVSWIALEVALTVGLGWLAVALPARAAARVTPSEALTAR